MKNGERSATLRRTNRLARLRYSVSQSRRTSSVNCSPSVTSGSPLLISTIRDSGSRRGSYHGSVGHSASSYVRGGPYHSSKPLSVGHLPGPSPTCHLPYTAHA